uniref:Polysaccharide biosynthesis domain-containing protein n=1 Tax=Naja naja TaxID=35670 RepID=A0A8C6VSL6_NAJNA
SVKPSSSPGAAERETGPSPLQPRGPHRVLPAGEEEAGAARFPAEEGRGSQAGGASAGRARRSPSGSAFSSSPELRGRHGGADGPGRAGELGWRAGLRAKAPGPTGAASPPLSPQGAREAAEAAHALSLPAEAFGNDPRLEAAWAERAFQHAQVYFHLLSAADPAGLRLTRADDRIYAAFRRSFPDLRVDLLDVEALKSEPAKERRASSSWPSRSRATARAATEPCIAAPPLQKPCPTRPDPDERLAGPDESRARVSAARGWPGTGAKGGSALGSCPSHNAYTVCSKHPYKSSFSNLVAEKGPSTQSPEGRILPSPPRIQEVLFGKRNWGYN